MKQRDTAVDLTVLERDQYAQVRAAPLPRKRVGRGAALCLLFLRAYVVIALSAVAWALLR